MTDNIQSVKITIKNSKYEDEEIILDLGSSYTMKNNLIPVEVMGRMSIGHVSRGVYVTVSGYVTNKNFNEEYARMSQKIEDGK